MSLRMRRRLTGRSGNPTKRARAVRFDVGYPWGLQYCRRLRSALRQLGFATASDPLVEGSDDDGFLVSASRPALTRGRTMLRRMVDAEQTDAVLDQLRAKEVYEIFQDWRLIATIVDPGRSALYCSRWACARRWPIAPHPFSRRSPGERSCSAPPPDPFTPILTRDSVLRPGHDRPAASASAPRAAPPISICGWRRPGRYGTTCYGTACLTADSEEQAGRWLRMGYDPCGGSRQVGG